MKYTVLSEYGDEVTLEYNACGEVVLDARYIFTKDGFKEFRRAVGYVWQEVENA